MNRRRPALRPVEGTRPEATFCGYCAKEAPGRAPESTGSRVCEHCRMGLLLTADAEVAPGPDDPFLVVDELLAVRALSSRAERLLDLSETDAVNRHVIDLLAPAETSPQATTILPRVLAQAVRAGLGSAEPARVTVRPRDVFGVRYLARIGPCRPGPAAVVVLGEAS